MSNLTPSEEKFYKALRDVFVGAKIEGKGGYVNLMNIKSRYFQEVLLKGLGSYIDELFPTDKEELFSKLYTFFNRYFSETGSICFQYTPLKENIYEKVYTNKDDVVLFYKTHMLYYVKSEKIWKSIEVTIKDDINNEDYIFNFDASQIELSKNNEKREVIFDFKSYNDDKISLFVRYSKGGTITKYDDIIRLLKNDDKEITIETLERAISIYKKQTEVDFFISKNANGFLKEQWDLWMYQYMFQGETDWRSGRISTLQNIKNIAYKLIDYISQFEDELVKIWNKPKFVRNSGYVISIKTLKKILKKEKYSYFYEQYIGSLKNNSDFLNDITTTLKEIYGDPLELKYVKEVNLDEENNQFIIKKQKVDEIVNDDPYTDLYGLIKGYFKNEDVQLVEHISFEEGYIDTSFFESNFSIKLIEAISEENDLADIIDGYIVHSDSFQYLNNTKKINSTNIDLIYIDPPFNTDNEQFAYVDKLKDSSWLSMFWDRLELGNQLLSENGSIYVHTDHNCNYLTRSIFKSKFGIDPQREIIWNTGESPSGFKTKALNWIRQHDTILYFTKGSKYIFNKMWKEGKKTQTKMLGWLDFMEDSKGYYLELYNDYGIIEKKYIESDVQKIAIGDVWNDIYSMMYTQNMTRENWGKNNTQKPENLLRRIIQTSSNPGSIVLDFFVGTGTTISTSHKLGRKWIGVDTGEVIEKVVKRRMKSVLVGDRKPMLTRDLNWKGGGFFKYYSLEQYEEALSNTLYGEQVNSFDDDHSDPYTKYIFLADEKMTRAISRDEESGAVTVDFSKLYPDIDIPETLSHLLGKKIKTIKDGIVTFADGQKIDTQNLDYNIVKPLIWWK